MDSQNVRQGLLAVIAVLAAVIVVMLALPAGAVIWLLAPVLALSLILYLVLLVRSVRQAGFESRNSQVVRQNLLVVIGILLLITLMLLALPGHMVVWICVPLWGGSLALYLVLLVRSCGSASRLCKGRRRRRLRRLSVAQARMTRRHMTRRMTTRSRPRWGTLRLRRTD